MGYSVLYNCNTKMQDRYSGQIPGVSRCDAEFLKTLPEYQEGKEYGLSAEEPPANLYEVTRIKLTGEEPLPRTSLLEKRLEKGYQPQFQEEPIPEKVAFRNGYFDGLKSFLAQHEISLRDVNVLNFPDVLTSKAGFGGFVRGLNRRKPDVGRDYTRHQDDKFHFQYKPEPEWIARQRSDLSQTLSGYTLGLILSVARDFGSKLNYLEVPKDDMAHAAFMQGLSAEPRAIPLRRNRSGKGYNLEDNPNAIYELLELDIDAYLAGLGVWLASQGLRHIKAWQIRHPEALRAFKTALEGQTLSEYEPKDVIVQVSSFKDESLKYPSNREFKKDSDLPLSPYELAKIEGYQGYQLGKTARVLRASAQSSTSDS